MNLRIITASAGTGKTTRLAQLLDEAIRDQTARPHAVLATTFTRQAAAELLNRARGRLLALGDGKAAQALLTARIGTVNAVCGALVADFAFELGLSPDLRVLDEAGAELELKRALAAAVTDDMASELQHFQTKFDFNFDWHYEARRLIEAARANGMDADGVAASAERSIASLDQCLGPVEETSDLDASLRAAIDDALRLIDLRADKTDGTQSYCSFLQASRRHLDDRQLCWGDWAKLGSEKPRKKSEAHAAPVQAVAAQHIRHPRLRNDLHDLIRRLFDAATAGMRAYQRLKKDQGLLDFVDQEVHALELLTIPSVIEALKSGLDLVLVDEFQDTSPLQLAIFLKLSELASKSIWVGDPKQAIYGFRGADPALMDAAIESLENPTRDPDLVVAAVEAIQRASRVETLSRSYRSRPALIDLTNAIFGRAFFRQQAMPEDRVRVDPVRPDSLELGPAVTVWPLSSDQRITNERRAQAVAAGVRTLLSDQPLVWRRDTHDCQPALASDLAVLCRTNAQCRQVSEALGQLGITSVVARVGLLASAEAQVLLAGLRLWVDPRDVLAAAALVRILDYPEDTSAYVDKLLDPVGREQLSTSVAAQAIADARQKFADLGVLAAVDAVIEALDLRRLCAGWASPMQRTANLDALRAHATTYCAERQISAEAASLVGFLRYLEGLAKVDDAWGKSRSDTIARTSAGNAVTVSTWHAAKGLEWPVVILFGLEAVRRPVAYGVHVLTDRTTFDISDPLGGRWIHFWPNPYTNAQQKGPVKDAYERSQAHERVSDQAAREALRVLYVGWTRARDQLVLAAEDGKLLDGFLGTLTTIDPQLIQKPESSAAGQVEATWAGHRFTLGVRPFLPEQPIVVPRTPGRIREGKPLTTYPPASLQPSAAMPRPARLGSPLRLGDPIRPSQSFEEDALGTAVHRFFAADDPDRHSLERREMAAGLLHRHRVEGALDPAELLEMSERLRRWVREQFGRECIVRSEWPLSTRLATGTAIVGASDFIVENTDAVAVIDHKSFGVSTASAQVDAIAGQLDCYAGAVARARPGKAVSTWVHLPFAGVIVEVC